MNHGILNSPASIGTMQLKNRFVLAAMGSNYATTDGHCSEQLIAYYEARAKGGAGLLILETTSVSWPAGCSMPNMVGFSDDCFLPGLRELTSRVHQYDCKIAAQLNHSGKVSQEDTIAGRPILVPSIPGKSRNDMMPLLTRQELGNFIKMGGPDGKGPRYHLMDQSDIDNLVNDFVSAAQRAIVAGFDGIEIHGGHGYVISSFLSPATNQRDDNYGGTVENRARLMVEIVRAIRAAVGPDLPIIIRLDAKEYRVENGITPDDFIAVARLAQEAGVDAIDVSAYSDTQKGIAFTEAPLVHQPSAYVPFSERVKRELDIPVIAVGRIELDSAAKDIANNKYDFLGLGRKLIADPELPNKSAAGMAQSIRPCIYCYICVSQIFINKPMLCAVNTDVGREYQGDLIASSTDRGRHFAVVGGGPGGMEAARLLATAGHRVTLFEKEPQLGGTARIAALAYEPNGGLIDYLSGELQRLKVDVQLNSPVDIAALAALNPDHVIVATGAKREAPEIPGKNLKHVFDGEEMRGLLLGGDDRGLKKLNPIKRALVATSQALGLTNNINWVRVLSHLWMPLQKDIVIVGGGLVGIEIAEFLVERRRRVTVLEPSSTLSPELSIVRRARVIHLLREHGCNMLTKASVSHIDQAGVHYEHKEQWHCIKADQVIIALGADADTRVSELIIKAGYGVTTIGDCRSIGYLDGAIGDARTAVSALLQPQS